jgi:hypothetical protein
LPVPVGFQLKNRLLAAYYSLAAAIPITGRQDYSDSAPRGRYSALPGGGNAAVFGLFDTNFSILDGNHHRRGHRLRRDDFFAFDLPEIVIPDNK